MKRIGVFVDVSNLYYCINKKFNNRKLDYRKYKRFVEDLGEIQQLIAYGAQMAAQANGFIRCLKQIGFQAKYKTPKVYQGDGESEKRKADWDVGIAIDIVNMIDRFDMVILGTGDGDMAPVVEWCMNRGVDVVVLAAGISRDLKKNATKAIEIPESLLETVKPKGAKTHIEMVEEREDKGEDTSPKHESRETVMIQGQFFKDAPVPVPVPVPEPVAYTSGGITGEGALAIVQTPDTLDSGNQTVQELPEEGGEHETH